MAEKDQSVTLHSRHYDTLCGLHCDVTSEGFVVVAGKPANISDGEEIEFESAHVTVIRHGDDYTFTRHY